MASAEDQSCTNTHATSSSPPCSPPSRSTVSSSSFKLTSPGLFVFFDSFTGFLDSFTGFVPMTAMATAVTSDDTSTNPHGATYSAMDKNLSSSTMT